MTTTRITPTPDTATVPALQDLITANTDCTQGFEQAAKAVADDQLARFFARLAAEHAGFADELRGFIHWDSCVPGHETSVRGQLRVWWIGFRGSVNEGAPEALLAESVRLEQIVKDAYETAAADIPASSLSDVLRRQYHAVIKSQDRLQALADLALPTGFPPLEYDEAPPPGAAPKGGSDTNHTNSGDTA